MPTPPLAPTASLDERVRRANIEYHNQIAADYESDVSTALVFTPESQRRIADTVAWLRRQTSGCTWVDVGCGTGNILKFARQHFGRAVGFDVAINMLQLARHRGLNVSLGAAAQLPIASATADVVSTFSVLHHLYDPSAVMSEIHRILKPGGFFYADFDPNGRWPLRRPVFYRVYHPIYRWLSKIMYGAPSSVADRNRDIEQLQDLAEFHHTHTGGIDPVQLSDDLRRIGFDDIGIYPSFSLLDPRRLRLPQRAGSFLSLTACPLFAIVARKRLS